jgi:hypothetical protein
MLLNHFVGKPIAINAFSAASSVLLPVTAFISKL